MKTLSLLSAILLESLSFAQVPETARKKIADFVDIGACWTRPANAEADRLGLPARFCVARLGLINPYPGQLPFDVGYGRPAIVVEGSPVSAAVHIGGGANLKDHWNIDGDLWAGPEPKKPKCGTLSRAFAAIYVDITPRGELLPVQKPEIRGFLIDEDVFCRTKAPSVDILYAREPAAQSDGKSQK